MEIVIIAAILLCVLGYHAFVLITSLTVPEFGMYWMAAVFVCATVMLVGSLRMNGWRGVLSTILSAFIWIGSFALMVFFANVPGGPMGR